MTTIAKPGGGPAGLPARRVVPRDSGHAGVTVGVGGLLLLFGYGIIEFVRPQIYVDSIAQVVRPALVLSVLITIYWLKNWGPRALFGDQLLVRFLLFATLATLWIPFAVNNYWVLQVAKTFWLLATAAIVPLGLVLVSPQRRRQYFVFWMLVHLYLAVFVLANSGRGPGGILEDENDMAFALGMALPYPFFLAQRRGASMGARVALYGLAFVLLAAIVSTNSRGGFVGLGCMVLYAVYLSRQRVRNLLICALLSGIAFLLVPNSYKERIGSITDTTDTSRSERLTSWRIGWQIFLDNPVLGVGPNNYGTHSGAYHTALPDFEPGEAVLAGRAAHSLYFTLLPESGLVGTALFLMIVIGAMKRLKVCERSSMPATAAGDDDAERDFLLARAIRASLIGFLTAGAFISVLYYPQFWYTLGFIIALSRDVSQKHGPSSAPGVV